MLIYQALADANSCLSYRALASAIACVLCLSLQKRSIGGSHFVRGWREEERASHSQIRIYLYLYWYTCRNSQIYLCRVPQPPPSPPRISNDLEAGDEAPTSTAALLNNDDALGSGNIYGTSKIRTNQPGQRYCM